MRVYFASDSDPMVTGSVAELNALASRLSEFIASPQTELFLPADTASSPGSYAALLPGIRLSKRDGPIMVTLEPTVGLSVAGSTENLALWCSYFRFEQGAADGDHRHTDHVRRSNYLEPNSLCIIVEVQEEAL